MSIISALRRLPPGFPLLLGLLSLGGLASCGDDGGAAAGCQVDADCRGARVCVEGQCVEDAPVNNDPFNNPPNNDEGCGGDLECSPEQVCDSSTCAERPCDGDPDCGSSDRFCYGGTCRAAIDCQGDADCTFNGGSCEAGLCVPGCVIDGECPDPLTQACADGVCRERCMADRDCDRGEVCDGVCQPAECQGVGQDACPDGERCSNGRCETFTPCALDTDCGANELCREGVCEARTRCVGDPQCPEGQQCLDGFCHEIELCQGRGDCGQGEDCVAGRCVPFVCRGAEDCQGDQICEEGQCQAPPEGDLAVRVIILNPPQAIAQGGRVQFQAVALDMNGDILAGQTFAWATSAAQVADIGQETGLAVGGAQAGQAQITATVAGSSPPVTSAPVVLTNAGPANPNEDRVIVVDAQSGLPIEGAVVDRDGQRQTTNANGVASFAPAMGASRVTIFESLHNFTTLVGVSGRDILVPLEPLSGGSVIGGFTGEMDFGQVHSNGDINVGLAGASLDGELANFDLETLLGDSFNTRVAVPGLFDAELPLPGGLVLDGVVFGFPLTIKDFYAASAPAGLKVAWALGGKIEAGEVIGLVMGGGGAGGIVRALLPFFENFDHTLRPLEVEGLARVPDSDDIDGDGDRGELIPNFEAFPEVGLTPRVEQRLRTGLSLPALPNFGGDPQDTFVITVGGIITEGIGFVPMGLNATQDESGDGRPDPVTLRMAPAHSGLSVGKYAVVALTFDPSDLNADLTSGIDLPDDYSTIVWQGSSIPADLDMTQAFLTLPEASWDALARQFSRQSVAGADLFRVTFIGPQGSWEVWLNGDLDGFELPTPPDGFQDWTLGSVIRVDAFDTTDDQTLDGISSANGVGLRRVSSISAGFSRAVIQ